MKKILIVLLLLIPSFNILAQENKFSIGVSGGTTFSSTKVKDYLGGEYGFNLGFGGELSCAINLNPHLFISTNVGVLERGYSFNYETPVITVNVETENSYFGAEIKANHAYLNNDWLIGYQFGEEFILSFSGGFYYSYYLKTKLYDRNYIYVDPADHDLIGDPALPIGYSENEITSKDRDQNTSNWDLGLVGCISLGYGLNDKLSIHISGRYYHGLADIYVPEGSDEVGIYNRSIVTFVGIKIKI
jgi:hypothetical protein